MTDWTKGAGWINGEIVPINEAKIGVTDWGLTHSDITYDVAPLWKGALFRLDDYLTRFEQSMAALHMDVGMDRDAIKDALISTIRQTGFQDAYVSMVASRGSPMIPGSRDPRDCANHFYGWVVPYVYVIPKEKAAKGATMWVSETARRIPADSVNPRAKNYHWGDFTQALFEAKERGFDTGCVLDHDDNMTEGPGFNVFIIKDGKAITSDHGVLHGISRRTVLEICKEMGIETETRPLPMKEFMEADEVFLSTSGGGVTPIRRVKDRTFSNDAPGPVTMQLYERFHEWLMRDDLRTPV